MKNEKQKKFPEDFLEGQLRLPKELEFNLSDFALFLAVMKNPEAHRCVLSINHAGRPLRKRRYRVYLSGAV